MKRVSLSSGMLRLFMHYSRLPARLEAAHQRTLGMFPHIIDRITARIDNAYDRWWAK